MRFCAPAVVTAHAALESGAAHDGLVVVPGQLIEVAGIFQLMRRIGQRREGHSVPCKADARDAAGDSCTVHASAAAAILRVDWAVLGKVLPDVVIPSAHFAACGAVGGGLPGAKTQIGDLGQLPAQREEQPELRQFGVLALPCHRNVAAACAVDGKINGPRLPVRQGVDGTHCDKFSLCFGGQIIAPGVETGGLPEGKLEGSAQPSSLLVGARQKLGRTVSSSSCTPL